MALDPRSPENLRRDCVQLVGLVKLTKATLYGVPEPTLRALLDCRDLTARERRTVEALVAERPMRAFVLTGAIGPAPTRDGLGRVIA